MDYFPDKFVDVSGKELTRDEAIGGYKVVIVVYSAAWWPGCTPFKANLKEIYGKVNEGGAKNLQVVIISGDKDQGGYAKTMDGAPWVGVPLGADTTGIAAKVPCTGYPTPGVINGTTGAVIDPDAFGKVSMDTVNGWIAQCSWASRPSWNCIRDKLVIKINKLDGLVHLAQIWCRMD